MQKKSNWIFLEVCVAAVGDIEKNRKKKRRKFVEKCKHARFYKNAFLMSVFSYLNAIRRNVKE